MQRLLLKANDRSLRVTLIVATLTAVAFCALAEEAVASVNDNGFTCPQILMGARMSSSSMPAPSMRPHRVSLTASTAVIAHAANGNSPRARGDEPVFRRGGVVATPGGLVHVAPTELGYITRENFVATEVAGFQRNLQGASSDDLIRRAIENVGAMTGDPQGFLTVSDEREIHHRMLVILLAIDSEMSLTVPAAETRYVGLETASDARYARVQAFQDQTLTREQESRARYLERNQTVSNDFSFDPVGFIRRGEGPFNSAHGDIHLLTQAQILSLPLGTILVDFRTGERMIKGMDQTPQNRFNGFTSWGVLVH